MKHGHGVLAEASRPASSRQPASVPKHEWEAILDSLSSQDDSSHMNEELSI